jgi:hypothetical protein
MAEQASWAGRYTAPAVRHPARRARRVNSAEVHGLLRSFLSLGAAVRAAQPRIYAGLLQHRAITRLSLASLALAVALAVSLQNATVGATPSRSQAASLLPESVGIGSLTTDPIAITFADPMDPSSVAANLSISPASAVHSRWSADRRVLTLQPLTRWRPDMRYLVSVAAAAQRDDGSLLGASWMVSFTTQTAPTVTDFQVRLLSPSDDPGAARDLVGAIPYGAADYMELGTAPLIDAPEDTLSDASSETGIRITFAGPMDRADF